jgi:hypothetical protein
MMGKKWLSETVLNNKMNLEALPKGIYWIQINDDIPMKMIKN